MGRNGLETLPICLSVVVIVSEVVGDVDDDEDDEEADESEGELSENERLNVKGCTVKDLVDTGRNLDIFRSDA